LGPAAESILRGPDGNDDASRLLDDEVVRGEGVDPQDLNARVAEHLRGAGVTPRVAQAFAEQHFEDYLRSYRRDGNLEPLYVPRDTKLLDMSRTILFNDVVSFLREAGFGGGYLFIDDIENLVDQMARKERIEFAKEFALCTVRPGFVNTAQRFFSCVLTTHQQASVSLAQAWGEAGLAAMAPLDPTGNSSVELPHPSPDQARQIIIAHLDHYRLNPGDRGSVLPFTQDGINELLGSGQTVHPRALLSRAAVVMQHASHSGFSSVDAAVVKAAAESAPAAGTDFTEGIDGAL
jgi:hypothetical protein